MEIAIVSAVRTAIGKFGGALTGVPAEQLGAAVIKEALSRAGVAPEQVSEVIMGCVLQAGLGQNPARQAAIHAGVPKEVPAFTVNNVCGSGLKCVNLAASLIQSGEAEIIVAGGMENMSAAPYVLPGARFGYRMNDGKMVDAMVHDALWDAFYDVHMGVTAENIAKEYGITREEQDAFAAASQQKCEDARKAGKFVDEIVPITILQKKAEARMSAAAILLTDTGKSITAIAEELGYSSIEHFSSAFKHYYHISPRQYRKGAAYHSFPARQERG